VYKNKKWIACHCGLGQTFSIRSSLVIAIGVSTAWPGKRLLGGSWLVCQLSDSAFACTALYCPTTLQLAHSLPLLGGSDTNILSLASWLLKRMETAVEGSIDPKCPVFARLNLAWVFVGWFPAYGQCFLRFFNESLKAKSCFYSSTGLEGCLTCCICKPCITKPLVCTSKLSLWGPIWRLRIKSSRPFPKVSCW